ncbi:MAG: class I SAM-dependent methyltransferase [Hyphomicrobiales bacterium]
MKRFDDRFSAQADAYARFRPRYPRALFDHLASLTPGRRLAWDCGTGSGQAARALADRFERVVATDASAEQLEHAAAHPRIEYRAARAEDVVLEPGSVDLVTVATAVHWFDFDAFYAAVRRAGRPDGILAVWTYHLPVTDPALDQVLSRYYWDVLAGHWPEKFRYVEDHYRSLPFPFRELPAPEFAIRAVWTRARLEGFLESWSATQAYRKARGTDPLAEIRDALAAAWGAPDRRRAIRWPLYLRVGTIGAAPAAAAGGGRPATP